VLRGPPFHLTAVQTLLNKNIGLLTPLRALKVDGKCGKLTITAIELFQQKIMSIEQPDGRVDPRGRTLRNLTHPKRLTPALTSTRNNADILPAWVGVASKEASWVDVATAEIGTIVPRS
jgi:hypothetical protein